MTTKLFLSIILALVTGATFFTFSRQYQGKKKVGGLVLAILASLVVGAITGTIYYTADMVNMTVNGIYLGAMGATVIAAAVCWLYNGDRWWQLLSAFVFAVTTAIAMNESAEIVADGIANTWSYVILALPIVTPFIFAGLVMTVFFIVKSQEIKENENLTAEDEERANSLAVDAWIMAFLFAVLAVVAVAIRVNFRPVKEEIVVTDMVVAEAIAEAEPAEETSSDYAIDEDDEEEEEEIVEETAEDEPWFKFYNLELLEDEDKTNDLNFGPDPTKGVSEDKLKDPQWSNKKLRKFMSYDPALTTATIVDIDDAFGAGIINTVMYWYFEETSIPILGNDEDIANFVTRLFRDNEDIFRKAQALVYEYLDLFEWDTGIAEICEDKMAMGVSVIDDTPNILFLKSKQKMKRFFRGTASIRGTKVEVAYNVTDGFIPTRVEKVYVPPKPTSTPTSTPTDGKTKVKTPTQKTTTPTMKTTDTTDYTPVTTPSNTNTNPVSSVPVIKEPSKSPDFGNAGGNGDNPGPGEATIGDSDRWSTKEDMVNDSAHMTYPEYKEVIEKDKKAEPEVATSPTASEPTKPNPNPDPITTDSNEKEIDKPTIVEKELPKKAEDNKPIDSTPVTSWGGLKGNED